MNERNVAALAALLIEVDTLAGFTPPTPRWVAAQLAARGVLVPSALDVQDCVDLAETFPEDYRFVLERIAKGEVPADA